MILKKNTLFILIFIILLIGTILIAQRAKKGPKEFTPPVEEVVEKRVIIAKVAIVIDDLGYNLTNLEQIFSIKKALTLSILPNLPYSERIALEADKKGYEVILHLPLESSQADAPMELNTICVEMERNEIHQRLDAAIRSVPLLKGISNHMGSKATENRTLMHIIFNELGKKRLYFLDSLVTNKSICEDLAEEIGVKFAKRDVYLDNIGEIGYIKNQFKLLIKLAKRRGSSIGIGHDRSLTIDVLAEEMPKSEKEGIEFVFVSELVNQY